jgi:hypothetical protein
MQYLQTGSQMPEWPTQTNGVDSVHLRGHFSSQSLPSPIQRPQTWIDNQGTCITAGTITKLSGWRWTPEQGRPDKTQVAGATAYAVRTSTAAEPRTDWAWWFWSRAGCIRAGSRGTPVYPCHYAEALGRAGSMTEPSSSARVGLVFAAGWSVSGQDGAAKSPYAAVLDWARTHYRILNQGSRVVPAEPGAGRRCAGPGPEGGGQACSSQLSG